MAKKQLREIVTLHKRVTQSGNASLYLHYTNHGERVRENLRLHLLPDTAYNRVHNENVMRIAESLKAERIKSLLAKRADTPFRRNDMLVTDLLRQWIDTHEVESTRRCIGQMGSWLMHYLGEDGTLSDVDRDFCADFASLLQVGGGPRGRSLAKTTARTYWQCFVAMMGWAYRRGWIADNPCHRLEHYEKPHYVVARKEYLTIDELRHFMLIERPKMAVRAYFFACFCGLRWSDLCGLRWSDLYCEEGRWGIRKFMQKTRKELFLPLSESALRWLPDKSESPDGECVFAMPCPSSANQQLQSAARKMGIKKHLTFHTSRHTFATMLCTRGVDIYTTSKLLGHTSVKTTQIYANMVDSKKRDAVDLLDGI